MFVRVGPEAGFVGMKQTVDVLNRMQADGIFARYAIGGAVAAYNYVEASATDDLDILICFDGLSGQPRSGLLLLAPIVAYLAAAGYSDWHAEGLLIEGWPVQFLPVADGLDAEALAEAQEIELEINSSESPVKTWILRAEHVVAIALKVGRMKDRLRILQFLEEEAVAISKLRSVLVRNGLGEKWQTFCRQAAIIDPCQTKDRP